jgi:hypothetical protein
VKPRFDALLSKAAEPQLKASQIDYYFPEHGWWMERDVEMTDGSGCYSVVVEDRIEVVDLMVLV